MPTYRYKAKNGPVEEVESSIEAQSEKEAIEKISRMGYVPIYIAQNADPVQAQAGFNRGKGQGVRSRDITIFTRQMASLLKAGVPILRALSIIAEQLDKSQFKTIIYNIYRSVKEGTCFSAILAGYPAVFSSFYVAMINTGENSGALPEILLRIADYREKQEEMVSRLRMALAYPVLMFFVGMGTVVFMLVFVFPRLMGVYANMGQSLPLPTRILISISDFSRHWGGWLILLAIILFFIVKQRLRSSAGKMAFSGLVLRLPVIGPLILKAELARFARTLELLLRSGLPILKAINITVPTLENEVVKGQLSQSHKSLEQGGSFCASLKHSRIIPPFMINLISVGEESGRIDDSLREIAGAYEKDTEEALRVMNNLLEPVMILGMGLVVGFIVMAMLLPIFEMNTMLQ
ncbi:MAG: type II secretion system F family protein [Candidatus Omnitrophica bacterium]|nr:type II secretion system F family protein [Candidatus Omnitrophota bacterium]MDD5078749.1 type II secretion system F family protein [Candidatus Omnitrophota bacterium]